MNVLDRGATAHCGAPQSGRVAMRMVPQDPFEKCVAIVDPDRRSRARTSRVVRRLGHMPVAFQGAEALRTRGECRGEFDLLLVFCPSGRISSMDWLDEVRSLIGREVPLGLVTADRDQLRTFRVMQAIPGDDAITRPRSAEDLYFFVDGLMRHQGDPALGLCPEWDGYHFSLATGKVTIGGEAIALKPREFDLAIGFFRHKGQVLSRKWLHAMVWGDRIKRDSRSLDVHVSRLRRQLHLRPESGLMLNAVSRAGYLLRGSEA